jgi:hypothetical protein
VCTKCTVHGNILMLRGTAKLTTDKIHVDTINRHLKTPKTSHNILYYENDCEYKKNEKCILLGYYAAINVLGP